MCMGSGTAVEEDAIGAEDNVLGAEEDSASVVIELSTKYKLLFTLCGCSGVDVIALTCSDQQGSCNYFCRGCIFANTSATDCRALTALFQFSVWNVVSCLNN